MAKLSTASIRLVQKLNRKNKQNEYPVYIVVCYKGRIEKSTGVSCLQKYWDKKREVIKSGCPNAPILNRMLNDIKQKVIDKKNYYEYNSIEYTPSMLFEIEVKEKDNTFNGIYNKLCDDRRLADGTRRRYLYSYNKLCEFLKKKDFIVAELTTAKMRDFSTSLEKDGIKENSIKSILCCVAAVWNYAVAYNLADASQYPFNTFKYTKKYTERHRDYFLEVDHIKRLKEYFLDLCIERNGKRWTYKEGVEDKLRLRYTKEFGILWFLMCYKLNGSAPIELSLLKTSNCNRINLNGEDYWAIDTKRKKTGHDVHIRLKRDLLTIIGLEHQLGFSKNGFVYPIINASNLTDKQMIAQSHKTACKAIKWVREAFSEINMDIAMENAEKHLNNPLVKVDKVDMYCARHSFASHYVNMPNSSIGGLASLMGRSPNKIATYVHQLTKDEDIAREVENMPI